MIPSALRNACMSARAFTQRSLRCGAELDPRGDGGLGIASIALPRIFRIGGGVSKELPEVPTMCGRAAASGSPANNPRVPDEDEMAMLYATVWAG